MIMEMFNNDGNGVVDIKLRNGKEVAIEQECVNISFDKLIPMLESKIRTAIMHGSLGKVIDYKLVELDRKLKGFIVYPTTLDENVAHINKIVQCADNLLPHHHHCQYKSYYSIYDLIDITVEELANRIVELRRAYINSLFYLAKDISNEDGLHIGINKENNQYSVVTKKGVDTFNEDLQLVKFTIHKTRENVSPSKYDKEKNCWNKSVE